MNKANNHMKLIICSAAMLVLILDSKLAVEGAVDGIEVCIRSAIPALFPAMILADILINHMPGEIPFIQRVFGIPAGAEGIFLAGIIGGYPIGAKLIGQHYREGNLLNRDAEHMLSFCNNAGPAFIFGICGSLFAWRWAPLFLWLIHAISAFLVGCANRNHPSGSVCLARSSGRSITEVVASCAKTMGNICAWIVLFRVIIQFTEHWLLWLLPPLISALIQGVLELTNGCCMLRSIASEPIRFVLCSIILSWGGFCIMLQTKAVTAGLSTKHYALGKAKQSLYSAILSVILMSIYEQKYNYAIWALILIVVLFAYYFKKHIAFLKNMIYNTEKHPVR